MIIIRPGTRPDTDACSEAGECWCYVAAQETGHELLPTGTVVNVHPALDGWGYDFAPEHGSLTDFGFPTKDAAMLPPHSRGARTEGPQPGSRCDRCGMSYEHNQQRDILRTLLQGPQSADALAVHHQLSGNDLDVALLDLNAQRVVRRAGPGRRWCITDKGREALAEVTG